MVTEVVYGSTTLSNPSPKAPGTDVRAKRRALLDGTQQVFETPSLGRRWRFSCLAEGWAEANALEAAIGIGVYGTTLTIDGDPQGYCTIVSLEARETPGTGGTLCEYTVEFAESTAGVVS
jgi:hypothetical protein